MKLLLVAALLALPLSTFAKKKKVDKKPALYTYSYSNTPIKFNDRQYQRYIQPQLQSLVKNFYNILGRSHPIQEEILKFRERFFKQALPLEVTYSRCFNRSFDCEAKDWREIHLKLIDLSNDIHSFHVSLENLEKSNEAFIDKFLAFTSQLRTQISGHIALTERQIIMGTISDKIAYNYSNFLSFAKTNLDILMTSLVDRTDNKLFYALWRNFISPIEKGLETRVGREHLKQSLVKLNMQWNGFHFQIDREHITIDPKIRRTIKNMHRQWTLVLKIIVG